MAEIVDAPELRYTSDNQMPIAEMRVQFPGLRPEDPMATMKVVGWGNLAQEIQERYRVGDRVVIEGRLGMNTINRPEGFKEKQAELTAQRIHLVGADAPLEASPATPMGNSRASQPAATPRATTAPTPTARSAAASFQAPPVANTPDPNFDEIPF